MIDILDYIDVYRKEVDPILCDKIVQTLSASSKWGNAKVGEGEVRQDYRHCEVVSLSHWSDLDSSVFNAVGNAIGYYRSNHPFADITRDEGYNVLRYGVGSFFKEHADSFDGNLRTVSCSIALNDDYEGGEMAFFNGEKVYRLNKGDIIMFPSSFIYPHQILPVMQGVRYSIVTWMN